MKYITHIKEPTCLYLTWRTPFTSGMDSMRRIVAKLLRRSDLTVDLVYLKGTDDFNAAIDLGFKGYPAFPLDNERYENVLSTFIRRMPPRKRGDFHKYLNAIRIPQDAYVSDFALLGYSGAKLTEDTFNISLRLGDETAPFEFLIEVAGFCYHEGMSKLHELHEGDSISLEKEPLNPHDPYAIKIMWKGMSIGHINRAVTCDFHEWIDAGRIGSITIERIHSQSNYPKIFLFVEVV